MTALTSPKRSWKLFAVHRRSLGATRGRLCFFQCMFSCRFFITCSSSEKIRWTQNCFQHPLKHASRSQKIIFCTFSFLLLDLFNSSAFQTVYAVPIHKVHYILDALDHHKYYQIRNLHHSPMSLTLAYLF